MTKSCLDSCLAVQVPLTGLRLFAASRLDVVGAPEMRILPGLP